MNSESVKPSTPKPEVPAQVGGSGCYCTKKKTGEKVMVNNQERLVYEGPRGGKYVRSKNSWKSLSKIPKKLLA